MDFGTTVGIILTRMHCYHQCYVGCSLHVKSTVKTWHRQCVLNECIVDVNLDAVCGSCCTRMRAAKRCRTVNVFNEHRVMFYIDLKQINVAVDTENSETQKLVPMPVHFLLVRV